MATEAQVNANRRNAEKSTGPRTPEGKAAVGQNAVKHGLSGRLDVIKGEEQAEFDRHREALLKELRPRGAVGAMLAERAVSLSWRLKRVQRMQNEVFDALLADGATPLAKLARSLARKGAQDDEDLALGRAVVKDFANSRVLDRLLMYERRMEHSLLKTLNDLHLRRLRIREYISRHMDEIGDEPAGSVPVWGERSRVPEEVGRRCPTPAQVGGRHYEETPYGVTTNASGALPHHSTIPSFQGSAGAGDECGVEEQSCKTKPVQAGRHEQQVSYGTEVMETREENHHEETNPIWAGSEPEMETVLPATEEVRLGQARLDAAGKTE